MHTGVDCLFEFVGVEVTPAAFDRVQWSILWEEDQALPLTPGQRYWVGFDGLGDATDDCFAWTFNSLDGNNFGYYPEVSLDRSNDPAITFEDRSGMASDWTFCADTGDGADFAEPMPLGACCQCDGTCQVVAMDQCVVIRDSSFVVPSDAPDPPGVFTMGATCGQVTCPNLDAMPADQIEGETCGFPLNLNNLADPDDPTGSVSHSFSTLCSTTDGREFYPGELTCGTNIGDFVNDRWFTYRATTNGQISINLCGGADFTEWVTVFSNGTGDCPTTCPPPLDDIVRSCTAESCADLNQEVFPQLAVPGQCFLIRVGGNSASFFGRGVGHVRVSSRPFACPSRITPQPILGLDVGGQGILTANRTLNFSVPSSGGVISAIRIELKSIPPNFLQSAEPAGPIPDSFLGLVGAQIWAGGSVELCSIPSVGFGQTCPDGVETIIMTDLSRTPVFQDWNAQGSIHLFGSVSGAGSNFIIPGAVYEIRSLFGECDPAKVDSFSGPLLIEQQTYGDITGVFDFQTNIWSIPDGSASIAIDAPAMLSAFKGKVTAPEKFRVDLEGSDPRDRARLDGIITTGEIIGVIDGFKGKVYRFGPGICVGGSDDGKRGCDPNVAGSCDPPGVCLFECPADECLNTPTPFVASPPGS